jgi:hypothetical protein
MKDPFEVLRMKEQDLLRVKQEIEARCGLQPNCLEKNLLLPATGQLNSERSSTCPSPQAWCSATTAGSNVSNFDQSPTIPSV